MLRIAFFGLKTAFDYFQIGGTESFVRRLATQMVQEGNEVDYILYGDKENRELGPVSGLTLRYFRLFEDALDAIKGKYEHVITIYLLPKDRLKYDVFRRKNSSSIIFHFIYFGWPDSLIKRKLYFFDAKLFPYNGKLFCISPRQYKYVEKWAENAVYILPPVPENYFLRPEDKPLSKKTKISFLGRVDLRKGIDEVIDIFKVLKGNDKYECSICGIHIREDRQSLSLHNWLKQQQDIKYIEVDRQNYSPSVDDFVRGVLKEADVFIQPYQRLSSAIETPLLLLEAMASLCAVITKPFGNIPEVYGKSEFLVPEKNFISRVLDLLENISFEEGIVKERERLYERNLKLDFKEKSVAAVFWEGLFKR